SLFCIIFLPALVTSIFFTHHTPSPAIFTLSLHDALPISARADLFRAGLGKPGRHARRTLGRSGDQRIWRFRHLPLDRRNRDLPRSEEHTSELQSHLNLVCRLLLEKKKKKNK